VSKHKSSFGLLPTLLLGGLALIGYEKASALNQVATSWQIGGLKVYGFKFPGTLECDVPVIFSNTSRQSVSFDSLNLNIWYKDSIIGSLFQKTPVLIPTGLTTVPFRVSLNLITLLSKAVSVTKAKELVVTLLTVKDWAVWFQKNLGLRDVQFKGNIVIAGVQTAINVTQDLGNVTRSTTAPAAKSTAATLTNSVTS
jgi:hypothetical protein